jgi:hypothetical protein
MKKLRIGDFERSIKVHEIAPTKEHLLAVARRACGPTVEWALIPVGTEGSIDVLVGATPTILIH